MVLFMDRDLLEVAARRKNDAFALLDTDTPFAAEVKRVAAGRDLTLRELARRLGRDHTVVLRQIRDSQKTQAKTARAYAAALDVPPLYLRLLAGGLIADADETEMAIAALRAIAIEAWHLIRREKREVFWADINAALRSDVERTERVLAKAFVLHARAQINSLIGIAEKRDAILELTEILKPLGLDTRSYATGVSNGVLAHIYLMVSGTVSDDDARELVSLQRKRLKIRGDYTPEMDDHLVRMQADPLYVVELSGSEKAQSK